MKYSLMKKCCPNTQIYSGLWELVIFPNTIDFMATEMNYETFGLTTHKRKFLFAALRRFVLGAARLVVVRLVGCLR